MTTHRDWMFPSINYGPSLLDIENAVIERTGVARRELHAEWRDKRIARARAVLYYIASTYGGKSWCAIGRHMNRHHSTVLKMAKTVEARPEMYGLAVKAVKAELGIMA